MASMEDRDCGPTVHRDLDAACLFRIGGEEAVPGGHRVCGWLAMHDTGDCGAVRSAPGLGVVVGRARAADYRARAELPVGAIARRAGEPRLHGIGKRLQLLRAAAA